MHCGSIYAVWRRPSCQGAVAYHHGLYMPEPLEFAHIAGDVLVNVIEEINMLNQGRKEQHVFLDMSVPLHDRPLNAYEESAVLFEVLRSFRHPLHSQIFRSCSNAQPPHGASPKTLFALRKHTTPKTADDIRLAVAEYSAKVHQESGLLGGDCINAYAQGKSYE